MTLAIAAVLAGLRGEAALVTALSREPEARLVRRCVDVQELVTAVSSGAADVALLAPTARGLRPEVVERLVALAPVLVVVDAGDLSGLEAARRWGLPSVTAEAPEVLSACRRALARPRPTSRHGFSQPAPTRGGASTPLEPSEVDHSPGDDAVPLTRSAATQPAAGLDEPAPAQGRLVAVWGPTGAPGRTSTVVHLGGEASRRCMSRGLQAGVLLADADTYGPSLAPSLGVLEEIPGLAAACRAAAGGHLDPTALAEHAPVVQPGLRILTGLPRTDRWPELRPAALERVWDAARGLALLTLADVGFCLEQDEELSFDTQAPRRNGATLVTLECADEVVAICRADPLGVLRFVRDWPQLLDVVTGRVQVVVSALRGSAGGPDTRRETVRLLEAHCGIPREDIVLVDDDRDAFDRALLRASTLADVAPRSPARRGLGQLADRLLEAATAGTSSAMLAPPATTAGVR